MLARLIAIALAGAACSSAAFAQQDTLSGRVSIGIRSVDVNGSLDKYREDVNLDDGVRLLDFSASFTPTDMAALDRIDIDIANLGSDPFETIHLGARKYGSYEFTLNRRRAEYYYRDTIIPAELASIAGSTGGDFHTFDFTRLHDAARLGIHLSPATELTVGFDRYTRSGDSTTTLDVARDEFELDRPVDDSLDLLRIGIEHAWDRVTLIVEQESSDFENRSHRFLPGASSGLDPVGPAELSFFEFDQAADYKSRALSFRVLARPTNRLDLNSSLRTDTLDLEFQGAERAQGIDFDGSALATDIDGAGTVDRDLLLADLDLSYLLSERVRLIGGLRRQELEQRGAVEFGSLSDSRPWDMTTTGAEAGFSLAATSRVLVSAGLSAETRKVLDAGHPDDARLRRRHDTDRSGFFSRISYRALRGLELSASLDHNDIDDAFTRSSPTESRRYRLRARYRLSGGLDLSASWELDDLANRQSGWSGETEQLGLRLAYRYARGSIGFGLSTIDASRDIEQLVSAGARQDLYSIAYRADSTLADVNLRWLLSDRYTIGASLRAYENTGSYGLERDDFSAYVELDLRDNYFLQLRYRTIDYDEDRYDDYEADLLELGFGLNWQGS